jgi:hypothetical protein
MQMIASKSVKKKLREKHSVSFTEVEEAFHNFSGHTLEDLRAQHKSKPTTVWCLSETYSGRLLKLVFIPFVNEQLAVLRTAYEPDDNEVDLWNENQ